MKKKITILAVFLTASIYVQAQTNQDAELVTKACMNYIEGFYEGDTLKIKASLRPTLTKFGYFKNKQTGKFAEDGYMTYKQAIDYAAGVSAKKRFPKPDAPRIVKVLDISNHTAAAKITAWWGTDYLLLSREGDGWMIDQVLWEGPLVK
ncbi:nuclear transport factor 2 family protein [Emticicia sp. BO119]|uniref:nuclear transport factor 2 family protein n=1 Tax=Emticicia sp. BO119 TaxID=2757768 RepID=UPI0015F079E5|nr:nuclear transport factor 2 family protein [Emticicia sp. BO119]MBA4849223.1 nuclear transport factor 2 family protein [Emticicia sp. BO119]